MIFVGISANLDDPSDFDGAGGMTPQLEWFGPSRLEGEARARLETLQRSVAVEIDREMVCAVEGAPHAERVRLLPTALNPALSYVP